MKLWIALFLSLLFVCPAHAYIVGPPPSLEKLTADSDLVFKGIALDTQNLSDTELKQQGFGAQQTRFRVVSVIKGEPLSEVAFRSYHKSRANMFGWHPQFYEFVPDAPYIIWAKKGADGIWRQSVTSPSFLADTGAMRAGDSQPVEGPIASVVWHEWNLLLASTNSPYVTYALSHLATFSVSRNTREGKQSFDPQEVSRVTLPFLQSNDPKIVSAAIRALSLTGVARVQSELIAFSLSSAAPETRAQALAALKGLKKPEVRAAAQQLLADSKQPEVVQVAALSLLGDWNDAWSHLLLQRFATSTLPLLRAATAESIGQQQDGVLYDALLRLTRDPEKSVKEAALRAFGRASGEAARPYFEILRQTPDLWPMFTVLMAQEHPEAYLPDLQRIVRDKLEVPNLPSQSTVYTAWHTLFDWLEKQPATAWQTPQVQQIATSLETGQWGSSEPVALYKLLLQRRRDKEAQTFRAQQEKTAGYDIGPYFRRADQEVDLQRRAPAPIPPPQ